LEGLYNPSQKFSTRVSLDVIRLDLVNIPSSSTAANNETRTYRGEWSWTYQLLKGLTATQLNQLNTDYVYYTFLPANNRLGMDLRSLTTLNAVLTPRASIEITHDARTQPSGNYTVFPDGLTYFSQSDEGRNYTLRARVTYAPAAIFALSVQTEYLANQRATF